MLRKLPLLTIFFSHFLLSPTPTIASGPEGQLPHLDEPGAATVVFSRVMGRVYFLVRTIRADEYGEEDPQGSQSDPFETRRALFETAMNSPGSGQYRAIKALWNSGDEYQGENRERLSQTLLNVACDPRNFRRWEAMSDMWYSGSETLVELIRPVFLQVAASPQDHEQWSALTALWSSQDAENRADAYPHFLAIARNLEHPWQWPALRALLMSKPQLPEYRRDTRFTLRTIAQMPQYKYREDALHFLRGSDDAEDRELGLQLQ